jgi:hypothetical protein
LEKRDASGGDVFEGFIFAWIAFNGWAECVSDEESDAKWVRALSFDRSLQESFTGFMEQPGLGPLAVREFAAVWPIPKAQDIRRHARYEFIDSRPVEKARFFGDRRIDCAPKCWLNHHDRDGDVPLDWPHFLAAAYRVRCNLFHGEKSPYDPSDARIVGSAFTGLVGFLVQFPHFCARVRV